jgi:NTP pyrophosphatase (non-canonical NTP hydrolase)
MLEEKYSNMVKSLAKPGLDIVYSLSAQKAHLTHMALLLCGETGELVDAIKKHTIYKKPLDLENVIEELGDIEFALEGIRSCLEIKREQVLEANIEKLSKRYSSGSYSDNQAIERADKKIISLQN